MASLHKLTGSFLKRVNQGKLNSDEIKSRYDDGGGLRAAFRKDGVLQWSFRYTLFGKREEIGLGSMQIAPNAPLKEYNSFLEQIRTVAASYRSMIKGGKNPKLVREQQRIEALRKHPTLESMMEETLESRKQSLKDGGKAGRWDSPLRLHVIPNLGRVPIEKIDQIMIRDCLKPIWNTKSETARKAINRLGVIVKYAAAAGLDVDMQVTQKAKALLGDQAKNAKPIDSMDWKDVPAFYDELDGGGVTELALQFLVITATRTSEVRKIHFNEIKGDVWTLPAERTKTGVKFQVPLTNEAQRLIRRANDFARDGYLFPGLRKETISDMALLALMNRKGLEARPHGFRASFRTWCAEATDAPRELAEMSLAHSVGSKVEQAYQRSNLLQRRRALMEQWSSHVTGGSGKLVELIGSNNG